MFGHPVPSTLATLQRFGVTVYRTDENGAVIVVTDGARYTLLPMLRVLPSDGLPANGFHFWHG